VALQLAFSACQGLVKLCHEVEQLRAEVVSINNSKMSYAGSFKAGEIYRGGDVVSCHGSLWLVRGGCVTSLKPGTAEAAKAWVLIAKRGSAP